MIKFIKNYGVYIAEFISAILLLVIVYYAVHFFCLLNDRCYNYYFKFTHDSGYQSLIGGNGLIIGCDDEGESKHVETSIDEIKKRVTFIGNQEIVHGQNGITLYPLPTILNDDDIARMVKDHD